MLKEESEILPGIDNKPILLDVTYHENAQQKPLVIYVHGYNGFKDWGNFGIVVGQLVEAGLVVAKFNFSHNGTSPEFPEKFVDLEAFSNNNYTKQLDELGTVINWCLQPTQVAKFGIATGKVALIGHSLGGGLTILKAADDDRVSKLITWAAISECKTPWGSWSAEKINDWKQSGVAYTVNGRTGQQMPLKFQLYEDYQNNTERLNIEAAIKRLHIPILIIHGTLDGSVLVKKAHDLKNWQPNAELFLVESDHVFGRKHPWPHTELPIENQKVVDETMRFINNGW